MIKKLEQYPFVQAAYHSSRRGNEVELVVLHYTAGRGDSNTLAKFFAGGSRKASAHFGVGRPGGVIQMVDLDRSAWHAGKSSFLGEGVVGWKSIGIEICNTGWAYMDKTPEEKIFHGTHRNPAASPNEWEKFTWQQVEAVQKLLIELKTSIPTLKYVTGHEDIRNKWVVDGLKGSKTDPGPAFPWHTLKIDSIGLERQAFSYRDKIWYHVPEATIAAH